MLLAGAGAVGFDPRDVAAPLNAAIFGLNVFVVGRWLRSRLQSRFLLAWGCLAVALSVPPTNIASWALSETTFVLFARNSKRGAWATSAAPASGQTPSSTVASPASARRSAACPLVGTPADRRNGQKAIFTCRTPR